jgi:Mce-associated membrane protein
VTAEHDAPEIDVTDGDEPDATGAEPDAIDKEPDAAEKEPDATDDKAKEASTKPKRPLVGRIGGGARRHWVAVTLAVALIAAAGLTSWMFFAVYRADRAMDDPTAQSAINAASEGTTALLSYSPESLDKDFATAKSKLTGSFLSYYTQFTEQIVAPAAKEKAVKTQAAVVRAALSEIHPDSAVVLVFINQTTESKDRPDASFINSAVRVTLQKANDGWLISSFDPV